MLSYLLRLFSFLNLREILGKARKHEARNCLIRVRELGGNLTKIDRTSPETFPAELYFYSRLPSPPSFSRWNFVAQRTHSIFLHQPADCIDSLALRGLNHLLSYRRVAHTIPTLLAQTATFDGVWSLMTFPETPNLSAAGVAGFQTVAK